MSKVRKLLDEYAVPQERIVVVIPDEEGSKTYVRECPFIVRHFIDHYWDVLKGMDDLVIYTDNGNSIFPKYDDSGEKEPLLQKEYGIHQIPLPAPVHQFISPNDNSYHGR